MLTAFSVVLPVFSLIVIGWFVGRRGYLPGNAVDVLNGYVIRIALPLLLFQFVAEADWRTLWHPGFATAFALGVVTIFIATYALNRRHGSATHCSISALSASYANTAFLGIPISHALFGATGMAAAVVASLLTVGAIFAVSILLIEIDLHRSKGWARATRGVLISLARNPLITAPVLGGIWTLSGYPLPAPVRQVTSLLGASASPVALVTIGLFLALPRPDAARGNIGSLVALKLIGQPLVTFGFVTMLAVPAPWSILAVLIAALPTGTGPFMAAQLYRHDAAQTAKVILITTILSAATISALVALLV